MNSRRHSAICVDDDHQWNELHCCYRHVDPYRDHLLRAGTELLSSWASFNQISSPTDGGWSLRAVWNSGRPPYQWASGVQIAIIHSSDKTVIKSVRCTIREMITDMTNFISITDNCYFRFTHYKLNKLGYFVICPLMSILLIPFTIHFVQSMEIFNNFHWQ